MKVELVSIGFNMDESLPSISPKCISQAHYALCSATLLRKKLKEKNLKQLCGSGSADSLTSADRHVQSLPPATMPHFKSTKLGRHPHEMFDKSLPITQIKQTLQFNPADRKPSLPSHPPSLQGTTSQQNQIRDTNKDNINRSRQNPTTFTIDAVPHRCPHQLATKNADHVGGIDSATCLGRHAEYCRAVSDLRHLQAEILKSGLKGWSRNEKCSRVGTDTDTSDHKCEGDADRKVLRVFVNDESRVERAEDYRC